MSIENVKKFLDSAGLLDRYIELSGSTATVELAAQQLNCEQARIAKSMAMLLKNGDAIQINSLNSLVIRWAVFLLSV